MSVHTEQTNSKHLPAFLNNSELQQWYETKCWSNELNSSLTEQMDPGKVGVSDKMTDTGFLIGNGQQQTICEDSYLVFGQTHQNFLQQSFSCL